MNLQYTKEAEAALMLGYQYAINRMASSLDIEDAVPGSDFFSYDFTSSIESAILGQLKQIGNIEPEDLEHLFTEENSNDHSF